MNHLDIQKYEHPDCQVWLQGGLSPVLQYVESTIWPKKGLYDYI